MRACILFGLLILGAAGTVAITPNLTQGQGKKGGGFGGGGPGGGAAMMMSRDPGEVFDMFAKGRDFFLISEMRSLQGPLTQYAQEKGIANGQIKRAQYIDFHLQYKKTLEAGGAGASPFAAGGNPFGGGGNPFGGGGPGGNPFGGKGKKGGPDMMLPAGPAPTPDMINAMADDAFRKADRNGDGKLNQDEMPRQLKASLARFDKNGDGLIDMTEFRDYFLAQMTGDTDPTAGRNANQVVIDEDELDRKVVVLRAGKLPSNMPEWFNEYDLDKDGQVALYEWRKASKKSLDEFQEWDLNDDGFITPEEALKHLALLAKDNPKMYARGGMASMGAGGSLDPNSDRKAAFGKSKKGDKGGDPSAPNPWANMGKQKGKKGGKDQSQQEQ